jgi:tRNA dimethylallyltransferase
LAAEVDQALRAIEESFGWGSAGTPPIANAVVAIVGPTASGKTELAVSLAERLGGEVVSADSVQIYRGFDIGSGKPTPEELARAVHHMVGTTDPLAAIDAAAYAEAADRAIADIVSRGKRVIVCGGTFLWVKALLYGLAHAPPANEEIRARHRELAIHDGPAALHVRLREVDVELAARLHPNDVVRVSRGLEVFELTGRPLSAWQGEHGFRELKRPSLLFALRRAPDVLRERIEGRVAAWLAAGWIDEVRGLLDRGYGGARAMGSVGYREVAEHLAGRLPEQDLALAVVRATRIFARRQRTWLNHGDVRWLEPAPLHGEI